MESGQHIADRDADTGGLAVGVPGHDAVTCHEGQTGPARDHVAARAHDAPALEIDDLVEGFAMLPVTEV